jgi:hypothetical protein
MTTRNKHHERADLPVQARTPAVERSHGILERWRNRVRGQNRPGNRRPTAAMAMRADSYFYTGQGV